MNISSTQREEEKEGRKLYHKSQSFDTFVSTLNTDLEAQQARCIRILEKKIPAVSDGAKKSVLEEVLKNLKAEDDSAEFKLTIPIGDELSKLKDNNVSRYLFHRYRYDLFPRKKKLDEYPPYLQIEPSSVCNYRCVFCYQTDKAFTEKKGGMMGQMSFDLFRKIIDEAEGNIEFFSLASRGEPFVCRDIGKMLRYCKDKFLGLKVNTNASLLTEDHCHAILSGGVNTLVISADAAVEPLYSQMRVNGKLERVMEKLRMFSDIKKKDYPDSKLITRVSGVKYNQEQTMASMTEVWGPLVDQVCFVDYNPWENVYESPESGVREACSDLWRRMFVWFDGAVNPCDTDYRSTLRIGRFPEKSISDLWRQEDYQQLRESHLEGKRSAVSPCRQCTVV